MMEMHDMSTRFSDAQLQHITDQAMIYMCACPAQVARQILSLRELFGYQLACVSRGALMEKVHTRIAESTARAHAELEQCLDEVLDLEGWDKTTLTMPEGLRKLRDQSIDNK
jgi:hypothetical protein